MCRQMVLVVLVLLGGCSSKAVYDNIQLNNRLACNEVPPPRYEECIERTNQPYEAYERARKQDVIREPSRTAPAAEGTD